MLSALLLALVAAPGWGPAREFCAIQDKAINESSGLAASRTSPGQYFTHNDSGDRARFFRFDRSGKILATYSLKGVQAIDWEDIATYKNKSGRFVLLGDIGDNAKKRKNILIYRLAEPTGSSKEITKFDTLTVTYPGTPRDCEAMFADPANGDIYLLSKSRNDGTEVFYLPHPPKSGNYKLTKLGTVAINTGSLGGTLVTAADASANGKYVAVRTYSGALEFAVTGKFRDWWRSRPNSVPVMGSFQSEAIAYSPDSNQILTTSEGSPCPVFVNSRQN